MTMKRWKSFKAAVIGNDILSLQRVATGLTRNFSANITFLNINLQTDPEGEMATKWKVILMLDCFNPIKALASVTEN